MKKYLAVILFLSSFISVLYAQVGNLPLEAVTPIIHSPGIIWKFVDDKGNPVAVHDSMLVYSQVLTAVNGDPISGYTWTLSSGSVFPPGVTVEPLTGILKGTGDPLIAGDYKFIMTVSDAVGSTAHDTISYTVITDSGTVDFFNSSTLQDSIIVYATGNPFSFTGIYFAESIEADLGFRPAPTPLTWTIYSGSLPPGLVLDLTRGVIRGTPSNSDDGLTYHFRIKVTDKVGRVGIGPIDSISVISLPTSIQQSKQIPFSYKLEQNYPNPFNPSTTIRYQIPEAAYVILKVFNLLGEEVATLVDKQQQAGIYNVQFSIQPPTTSHQLASGIYFYRITAGNFTEVKKLMVLK